MTTIEKKSVVAPVAETEPLTLPKKVVVTPAVVFISYMPLLVRLPDEIEVAAPPIAKVCVASTPAPAVNVPPAAIVTFDPTFKPATGVAWYVNTPLTPWPTVKLLHTAVVISIVTVWPSAMVTLSVATGIPAGDQVAGLLHRPDAAEIFTPPAAVVALPSSEVLKAPSVTAYILQK